MVHPPSSVGVHYGQSVWEGLEASFSLRFPLKTRLIPVFSWGRVGFYVPLSQLESHISDLIQTQHFIEKKTGARKVVLLRSPERGENQDPRAGSGSWTTQYAVCLLVGVMQQKGWQRSLMSPGLAARTPGFTLILLTFVKLMFNKMHCTLHYIPQAWITCLHSISHGELCGEAMNLHVTILLIQARSLHSSWKT